MARLRPGNGGFILLARPRSFASPARTRCASCASCARYATEPPDACAATPVAAKRVPRGLQDGPRGFRDGPRALGDAHQVGSKGTHKRARRSKHRFNSLGKRIRLRMFAMLFCFQSVQDGHTGPPNRPKKPQEAPTRAPRRPLRRPRWSKRHPRQPHERVLAPWRALVRRGIFAEAQATSKASNANQCKSMQTNANQSNSLEPKAKQITEKHCNTMQAHATQTKAWDINAKQSNAM